MAHAFLSPSGAPAWTLCLAKPWLEKDLPDRSSKEASDGTASHTLGADCLEYGYRAEKDLGRVIEADGLEFVVDQERADYVQVYVDYVEQFLGQHSWYGIEISVPVEHITDEPDATGTSDAVVVVGSDLHVIDLKYGRGVQVDAPGNAQLRIYGSGVLRILPDDIRSQITHIHMHIVQPRLHHISVETLTREELRDWAVETAAIARRIMAGPKGLDATPGEKQCKFCLAAGSCRARADHNMKTVAEEFEVLDPVDVQGQLAKAKPAVRSVEDAFARLATLTPDEIARLLPHLDQIIDWCNAVQGKALEAMLGGTDIPGHKIVRGRAGNRAWKSEEDVEKLRRRYRGDDFKQDVFYASKLLGPAALEKELKKKHPDAWEKFATLIVQPEGKLGIAPLSDKRPAIELANAIDDFRVIGPDE